MPTKIEEALTHAQFAEFCEKLLALPGKQRTLRGIQNVASEYGITVSHEGAKSFKKGPFARYIERLNRSRETREALCAAVGAGVHPLNAIEDAMVIELQDHIAEAETVDIKFVVGQLTKLRTAISMREDSHRKQTDLERRLRESEKKIEVAEKQVKLRDEQIAKLTSERADREAKLRTQAEALQQTTKKASASPDEIRTQTVALIDEIMGIKPKKA